MNDIFDKRFCSMTGKKQSLEDLIEFPTDYSYKFMGLSEKLDLNSVIEKIEKITTKKINKENIKSKKSSKGKYTSYTLKIHIENPEVLKSIYVILKEEENIAYVI